MPIKILLIDDDRDDRDLLADACKYAASDIECTVLTSCDELFLQLAGSEDELPDLILMDVNMPQIGGMKCLALLKEKEILQKIHVIMYSTTSHSKEISRAKELGALCFFTKPNDFTELVDSVEILAQHFENNTLDSVCENSDIFF